MIGVVVLGGTGLLDALFHAHEATTRREFEARICTRRDDVSDVDHVVYVAQSPRHAARAPRDAFCIVLSGARDCDCVKVLRMANAALNIAQEECMGI